MSNKDRYAILKAIAWILVVFAVVLFLSGEDMVQYTLSLLGMVYLLAYSYRKVSSRVLMLVWSTLLTLLYVFVNPSVLDVVLWLPVVLLVATEKEEEVKA